MIIVDNGGNDVTKNVVITICALTFDNWNVMLRKLLPDQMLFEQMFFCQKKEHLENVMTFLKILSQTINAIFQMKISQTRFYFKSRNKFEIFLKTFYFHFFQKWINESQ